MQVIQGKKSIETLYRAAAAAVNFNFINCSCGGGGDTTK